MRLRMMMAVAALGCGASLAVAQMPEPVAVGTVESPAKALDKMLGMFAAGSAEKFDGVRTFAEEITHLISANYYFYGAISGVKPDVDMKALGALTKKDDIVKAFAASFEFAHKAIATITAENAFVGIKPIDGMDTRASLAAFGVAHGYDHYGQMVEYLRMNGIVPPGSK
jgi:uncharacterized damage-inducible protein DinB